MGSKKEATASKVSEVTPKKVEKVVIENLPVILKDHFDVPESDPATQEGCHNPDDECENLSVEPESTFATRLVSEQEELTTKRTALMTFIRTATFRALPRSDKGDLKAQFKHMSRYLTVLDRRISKL